MSGLTCCRSNTASTRVSTCSHHVWISLVVDAVFSGVFFFLKRNESNCVYMCVCVYVCYKKKDVDVACVLFFLYIHTIGHEKKKKKKEANC